MYLAAGAGLSRTGRLDQLPRDHRRCQQPDRCRRQANPVPARPLSLANLDKLANKQTADAIRNDLNTDDDSKRTLKSIDTASANQLFSIFGLKDPGCDKNNNGQVDGDELKCLGKIWKYFVPK